MVNKTLPAPLLERTLTLLKNAPRNVTYSDMAKATGVSVSWVSRLAGGKCPNPRINEVQALHDYLANIA